MSERCTEAVGWVARWRLDHHCVRILLVRNDSEVDPLFSAAVPAAAPDLAEMREQYPKLSELWDAIRGEYWAEVFTAQENSC
ncbi:hypothetical protein K7711_38310 [Nocardia sp. CA2R105]|uniref:hypothetical protein n=1 Tax=Nocardia coffeae TaxID=2873381 RepID=UPI001CA606C0|nr:hypothetical protein [Nocardia coffeae]MBY8862378.1 hypothetical protein [Nocardia coffeae]